MSERQTDNATLIAALRILARDIQSGDGCANACLLEVAARLETLVDERRSITTLLQKVETLEADNARLREERRQREALWLMCAKEARLVYGNCFMPKPLPTELEVPNG